MQNLNTLARLVLVRSLKSVTLGNRVAVKGTVEEGIEELFCEGRAPFDLWPVRAENSVRRHAKLAFSQYFRNKKGSELLHKMTKQFVLSFYIGARDPRPLPEVRVSLFWRQRCS